MIDSIFRQNLSKILLPGILSEFPKYLSQSSAHILKCFGIMEHFDGKLSQIALSHIFLYLTDPQQKLLRLLHIRKFYIFLYRLIFFQPSKQICNKLTAHRSIISIPELLKQRNIGCNQIRFGHAIYILVNLINLLRIQHHFGNDMIFPALFPHDPDIPLLFQFPHHTVDPLILIRTLIKIRRYLLFVERKINTDIYFIFSGKQPAALIRIQKAVQYFPVILHQCDNSPQNLLFHLS